VNNYQNNQENNILIQCEEQTKKPNLSIDSRNCFNIFQINNNSSINGNINNKSNLSINNNSFSKTSKKPILIKKKLNSPLRNISNKRCPVVKLDQIKVKYKVAKLSNLDKI
jgi:hypothetical protein